MIVGVDLSTKEVHMVRRTDGTADGYWRRIRLESGMHLAERDAMIAREVGAAIAPDGDTFWDGVWLAGVEYPYTNPKAMASVGLKTIMGAIVATIPRHVHVIPLPARVWTPYFLREDPSGPLPKIPRKSAERKPLIKARAMHLLEIAEEDDIWPQDAYDAFGISWAVETINEPALR